MYIDTTQLPEDFNSSEYINRWNQLTNQGIIVKDPTKTNQGLWSQITTDNQSVYRDSTTIMSERIDALELQNKFLSLSIFMLQGKFTQEEVNNIKDMLTSNDEASITLADTIIENA